MSCPDMKLWKKITLGLFGLIALGGIGMYVYLQVPADLRTDYVKNKGESTVAQQKGRRLLEQSLKELDPMSQWKEIRKQDIQVTPVYAGRYLSFSIHK